MATITTESPVRSRKPGSFDQWVKRGIHTVTLPSGMVAKVRIPDLSRLLKNDLLPERLRAIALQQAFLDANISAPDDGGILTTDAGRYETAKELANLVDWIVVDMVIEPVIDLERIDEVPSEDRAMLAEIAQRERETDAEGRFLGVEPLSRWDRFRGVHDCPTPCPSCETLQREFSTLV